MIARFYPANDDNLAKVDSRCAAFYSGFCLREGLFRDDYVGHVILLPATVLRRCFAITFLEQLGPGWALFAFPHEAPQCPRCGYDLRGNPAATSCPECGAPLVAGDVDAPR